MPIGLPGFLANAGVTSITYTCVKCKQDHTECRCGNKEAHRYWDDGMSCTECLKSEHLCRCVFTVPSRIATIRLEPVAFPPDFVPSTVRCSCGH